MTQSVSADCCRSSSQPCSSSLCSARRLPFQSSTMPGPSCLHSFCYLCLQSSLALCMVGSSSSFLEQPKCFSQRPSETTPSYHPLKRVLRGTNWPHPVCSWICVLSVLSHQSSPLECIGNRLGLSEVQVQSSFKGTAKRFYRQYELLNLFFY